MTTALSRCLVTTLFLITFSASAAVAESPFRERIQRTGTCPTGYVGSGNKCEALHTDTPRAYPYIPGTACPSGTFRSGEPCSPGNQTRGRSHP